MRLHSIVYTNASGRRVSRLDTFDGVSAANVFGYNARSEVTSALMGTNAFEYAYDPIGNRVGSSQNSTTNLYSANCINQYTAISNLCASVPLCEPTYDADGDTTSDGRFTYFWNGENRMVCASNDEAVVTYAYDHRGRMVQKDISHGGTEAQRIGYVWDNWNIIRETATDLSTFQPFNFSTSYVWGLDLDGTLQGAGGVGGLLAVLRDDGAFLPTYDANGNITEYVTTNGTVAAHYEYSAFGEPIVSDGELAASFTHQFSTKPYCAITGFNEYVHRKYMAEIGRWMSRDPIYENCDLNLSIFCNNSAYEFIDVLGQSATRAMGGRQNDLSSFLRGIIDPEEALKKFREMFPDNPQRIKDEFRRWEKLTGRRGSSLLHLKKFKFRKQCFTLSGALVSTFWLTVDIILTPAEVNAGEEDPFIQNALCNWEQSFKKEPCTTCETKLSEEECEELEDGNETFLGQ